MVCIMVKDADAPFRPDPSPLRTWGFWAVLTGAIAMAMVIAHIAGPSLEPRPSAGAQVGEIAGEITRSAWRSFFGLSNPEPEAVQPSIWSYLVFQYLWWLALLIAGVVLLVAIIENIGEIFSF